ncbi:hypothetical protein RB195_016839 [Necator americanus]|uniref:Uncharacterized protein n=1 Tax=Necator americanus TaxID=51031 RepID=A0ABR1C3H2_NECAM
MGFNSFPNEITCIKIKYGISVRRTSFGGHEALAFRSGVGSGFPARRPDFWRPANGRGRQSRFNRWSNNH